eukprot:CAMPEP_0119111226 /NCGR_PEP_ID=MMETSP1180-20130426/34665_1 /TAXON_ID=3052 ORGANISM="Chlamydomonas cf sp, Strain CCMP681" /NCGR_SAMPLE_ID=MMETSP1180 /ASSEMBLY_ACC=CAM_ASM_000741 /LENGTH=77 /DNA_ID=CAMNT_0007098077 /DNA_START=339 /DNA_END=572 /DNA_ORIENTATION=+
MTAHVHDKLFKFRMTATPDLIAASVLNVHLQLRRSHWFIVQLALWAQNTSRTQIGTKRSRLDCNPIRMAQHVMEKHA